MEQHEPTIHAVAPSAENLYSTEEFNRLFRENVETIKKVVRGEKQAVPILIVDSLRSDVSIDEPNQHQLDVLVFADLSEEEFEHRHDILRLVGAKYGLESKHVGGVWFMSEAWMGRVKEGEELPTDGVRNMPDKIEVIIIDGTAVDGRKNACALPLIRNAENEIVDFGDPVMEIEAPEKREGEKIELQSALGESFFQGFVTGVGKRLGLPVPPYLREQMRRAIDSVGSVVEVPEL